MNPDEIPQELRDRPQWICWAEESRSSGLTKIPKRPDGKGNAKSNDMATWGSFEDAVATAEERGWGLGFVFSDADPYVGIDLDDCLTERDGDTVPREWLKTIGLQEWLETDYLEFSPSGDGIHIITKHAPIPDWWTNVDRDTESGHEGVEVYESGRFFTFTGDSLPSSQESISGDVSLAEWLRGAHREFEGGQPWERSDSTHSGSEDIDVRVGDVLIDAPQPGERIAHPIHGSDTGSNFMVDEGGETWRCWRHGCTGNAMHLVGMQAGLIDCGEWDGRDLGSETWADIFDAARDRGLDVGEKQSRPTTPARPTAETDGGAAAADASDDTAGPATFEDRVEAQIRTPVETEDITLQEAVDRFAAMLMEEYSFVRPRRDVRGWRDTLYVYVAEDGTYEPHGESFIESEAERLLGAVVNNQRAKEIVGKIERKSLVRPGELTSDPHRMVVENGIVDLHTGELDPHTPEEYHRTSLAIPYDADAECPRIDEFFHEIVGDGDVRTLYQLVSHCIYKEYIEEKAAMLLGDGQNGKSVYLSLLSEFLGTYNVSRRSLQDFSENDFAANNLQGKLANLHPDMASEAVDELGVFKQLTGRDTLVADVKYERPIQFENHATLVFAANRMPKMGEDTHALWRRWIYVNFPYTFDPHDDDAKDPVPKRKLMDELTTEEELQGLLAKAVDELNRWWEEGTLFTDVATPDQVRKKMKRASEPVYDFAMTCLAVGDDDDYVRKDRARQCYREFAREEGLPTIADNAFGERLLNLRDVPIESGQRRVDGDRTTVYNGVRFSQRGRQVLGLDEDDTNQVIDDSSEDRDEMRIETVRRVVRELQTDDYSPGKGAIAGRMASEMSITVAQDAVESAITKGEIYSHDGGYRVD